MVCLWSGYFVVDLVCYNWFGGVVLILYCGLCVIVLLVLGAVVFRFGCLLVGAWLIC